MPNLEDFFYPSSNGHDRIHARKCVPDGELREDHVIPTALDDRVAPVVAKAVIEAARASGVARI